MFLKILQNSRESTCVIIPFLIKLQASACNFIKRETLAQIFSGEFCQIFKIFKFYQHPFYRTPPDECFSPDDCFSTFLLSLQSLFIKFSLHISNLIMIHEKTKFSEDPCIHPLFTALQKLKTTLYVVIVYLAECKVCAGIRDVFRTQTNI